MASICRDRNGQKRILFMAGDGSRKTIRLGKVNVRQAEGFKLRLEALIASRIIGSTDDETSRWVAGLPDDVHNKLAIAGLVIPRAATRSLTLGQFLSEYTESRSDVKPRTQICYGRTCKHLVAHFGPDKLLSGITPGDADAWRLYLIRYGLADSTIRRTCGFARQFFRAALRCKVIAENPFAELAVSGRANKAREYFLSRQDAERIVEACPDAQWRLTFSLARYGGLRTPSEIMLLKWADVDWERSRFRVHSPKTEHHAGHESRLVPIFPELSPHLLAAYDEAEPGTEYVVTRYRKPDLNLRTQLMRIIARAGLQPWPKLWQNLRSTRQTELQQDWPEYLVCAWMGNSRQVAREHYLQVRDEHFVQAAQNVAQNAAHSAHLAHNAAQHPAALSCTEWNVTPRESQENAILQLSAAQCGSVHDVAKVTGRPEHPALTASKTPILQTQRAKCGALDGEIDPDLATVVRAWPDLPADVKLKIIECISLFRGPHRAKDADGAYRGVEQSGSSPGP